MRLHGRRKLTAFCVAIVVNTLGFLGILLLAWVVPKFDPNSLMAVYTTFVAANTGILGLFVGANAAVHIKGQESESANEKDTVTP